MATISFEVCGVPVAITARSRRLSELFADYFRYYHPQLSDQPLEPSSGKSKGKRVAPTSPSCFLGAFSEGLNHSSPVAIPVTARGALNVELKARRALPPRSRLIPRGAELLSRTGSIWLWREASDSRIGERFYFEVGTAAFRVDPERDHLEGLITPEALHLPHILANAYTLFPLLLLLRSRGLYHLHAAAVLSPRQELYLICGPQRAGKTTLTTALGLAGWRPISDDSLLLRSINSAAQLSALKKSFHLSDDVLARWGALDSLARHHHYLERTCVAGLEFFGTTELADAGFGRVDYILLPQITGDATSSLLPAPISEAILKLAEQSMFFQLWRTHTERQWRLLAELARTAVCYRLRAGADILAKPHRAAELLEEVTQGQRFSAG
jgi:hypothetical protein